MKLSNSTKKAKYYIRAYERATAQTLDDVYKTYSRDKKQAYNFCVQECIDNLGTNLKILSANTFVFTAGFLSTMFGTLDLVIITKDYIYWIDDYKSLRK